MTKKIVCTLLSLVVLALVLGVGTAMAQETLVSADHVYALGYYANAKASGAPDAQLRLTNDGNMNDGLADIYVFNNDEQMEECCSCYVSPDGYLDLDVNHDLLGNELTPEEATSRGIIKVISSNVFPATEPYPYIGIRGWLTHIQNGASAGSFSITQSDLKDSVLSASEESTLATTCSFVLSLGSGAGSCSCGDAGH